MSTQLSEIMEMSVAERIQLAEDIWDSIVASPESVPLTNSEKAELDRRLQSYSEHPEEAITWAELQQKVRKST